MSSIGSYIFEPVCEKVSFQPSVSTNREVEVVDHRECRYSKRASLSGRFLRTTSGGRVSFKGSDCYQPRGPVHALSSAFEVGFGSYIDLSRSS